MKKQTDIKKDQLEDLLQWGQRRGFFKDSEALFSLSIWENLGREVWESVQGGNKIAARLAARWKKCLQMMQQITLETAAQDALKHALAAETRTINAPAPPMYCSAAETVCGAQKPPLPPTAPPLEEKTLVAAFPVEELNFWGRGNSANVPMAPLTPEEQAMVNTSAKRQVSRYYERKTFLCPWTLMIGGPNGTQKILR